MPEFWSIKDAAQYLGVQYSTVYRLIHNGELPAGKIGGVYRIRKDDLDAYFNHKKEQLQSRAARQDVQKYEKCSVCSRVIVGDLRRGGMCTYPGCDQLICEDCWENGNRRYCANHQPTATEHLEKATEGMAKGELEIVVPSIDAKLREQGYIDRFDTKINRVNKLQHPETGVILEPKPSWKAIHISSDDSRSIMDVMKTGFLSREMEQQLPFNLVSRYVIPGNDGGGLVLEARVFSHIKQHVQYRVDVHPADRNDLNGILDDARDFVRDTGNTLILGVASTTGWKQDAISFIQGDELAGDLKFYHQSILPFLIDLPKARVIFSHSDERLASWAALFAPVMPEEQLSKTVEYIERSASISHIVTASEVSNMLSMDESIVELAFSQLQETGRYKVETIDGVGDAILLIE